MASYSEFICNRFTGDCLELDLVKVNKNTYIYQNHKMTLYSQF